MEIKRLFKDFCESTSLHGYTYLYTADTIIIKFVWFLVISIMSGGGIFFLITNTNDFIKARLVTNIESSSASLDVSNLTLQFI